MAASLGFSARVANGYRGESLIPSPALRRSAHRCSVNTVCRASSAEDQSASEPLAPRRAVLLSATAAAVAAALALEPKQALAAYGEAANVFGENRGKTNFASYSGNGFKLDVPAKWNPSRELGEFPNVVVRFEDNFDATSNLVVIAEPTTLKSIAELGSPVDFIEKYKYLLGLQAFDKETASEGGFLKNTTLTAALLDSGAVEKGGKTYYKVSLLTRTADGDEGGKHQLFTAAVSGGKLYILKVQAGDKRWFKGARKFVEGADKSFSVA